MKKVIYSLIILISSFLIIGSKVKAETFYEGSYINSEYINKVIDSKTYYMTMQYIKDSKGNIVYCLEPFVTFENGKSYTEYNGELTGYKDLTSEQKRKISLIIYYGYGYKGRTSSKWYVVTQYLVWKVVDNKANIYFTDTLNGKKITKYSSEQEIILNDVNKHDIVPSFVKDYNVSYNKDLVIDGLDKDFEIVSSDYDYGYTSNSLIIKNVLNSGSINIRKISNYYDGNVVIYDSSNSQDVIRPGNVINSTYSMGINVLKGSITLDIRDDDSVYTVESDFSNTCYELIKEDKVIEKVCTNNDSLIYKTGDLEYGDYQVKQVSNGIGYLSDSKVYNLTISATNNNPTIVLYNKLIRNNIEIIKYACKDNVCNYEENAVFGVYDKNDSFVDEIITNKEGYSYITLGYGGYTIKQISGLEGYTLSNDYTERILDEDTKHLRILDNFFIEDKKEVLGETFVVEDMPDTKVDKRNIFDNILDIVWSIIEAVFDLF